MSYEVYRPKRQPGKRLRHILVGVLLAAVVAAIALFVLFYPALAGVEVSRSFSTHFLKWLPSWPL